jgi:DNA-binding CsgD family transcriptional regulator
LQWPLIGRDSDLDHAIELVEQGTGLALLGQAGVGKSRLLHELGDRAEQSGKTVVRTVATESTRSIPFAPFVELIPVVPSQDRLAALGMALTSLRERNRGRGLLLTVDDAHNLDSSSLAFLIQAVSTGAATVSMTARSGEKMDSDLVDLWTNGVIQRLEVASLTIEQVRDLVDSAMGDTVPGVIDELWRLSHGNPLILHELIEGAAGVSLTKDDHGVWRSSGPLARSARLADLVESRVAGLSPDAVPAMEVVAVGSPLPLAVATRACGERLQDLERQGLVTTVSQGRTPVVIPSHPMYGEIMVENMPATSRVAALVRLVEASTPDLAGLDPVRVAVWQAESGLAVSPEVALAGATSALNRHDAALAERLIRPLGSDDPSAALVLGRALSYQQRWQEAEDVLAGITDESSELAGYVASVRGQNLAFGLGRVQEGRELLGTAVESQSDPELRARLLNERAMLSAISGDFGDARRATQSVLSDPGSGDVSRVAAYVTLTVAQAMTGDSDGLDEGLHVALPLAESVGDVLPFASDQIEIMQLASHMHAGRIAEGLGLATEAISRTDRGEAMLPTWLSAKGLVLSAAGSLPEVVECCRRAIDVYSHADPFGLESQTRGTLALALGQLGDQSADELVGELPLHLPAPRLSVWVDRGKAWGHIARGEIDEAVEILVGGGLHAVAGEHFAWATFAFHDVVRVGRPEAVNQHLAALPEMPGSHLLHRMIEHGRALDQSQGDVVAQLAADFADMGAMLMAAEAWAQASALAEDGAQAARWALISMALERGLGEPVTPALGKRPNHVSWREADTAVAAAGGASSADIAEALFLSKRTVENHLQAVYRKCSIGGREELRELLLPVLEAGLTLKGDGGPNG